MNEANRSSSHNDEIDLFKLVENLWKEKAIIAVITLCFLIGGGLFAFLQTPTYQAEININQAKPEQIAQLQSLELYSQLVETSPLEDLIRVINSSSVQQSFIQAANPETRNTLYSSKDTSVLLAAFNGIFNITKNKEESTFPYITTLTAPSANIAESELDRFISFSESTLVNTYTTSYVKLKHQNIEALQLKIQNLNNTIQRQRNNEIIRLKKAQELKITELNTQLNVAKHIYRNKVNDQKNVLKEAYLTAEALNITKPVGLKDLGRNSYNKIELDISGRSEPLYLRGTELLKEELKQLEQRSDDFYPDNTIRELQGQILHLETNPKVEQLLSRKNNEAFNEELESLATQLHNLQSELFPADLKLSFSESPAFANPTPLKPKKSLILALSIILGGMIGVFVALIRSAIKNRKASALT